MTYIRLAMYGIGSGDDVAPPVRDNQCGTGILPVFSAGMPPAVRRAYSSQSSSALAGAFSRAQTRPITS